MQLHRQIAVSLAVACGFSTVTLAFVQEPPKLAPPVAEKPAGKTTVVEEKAVAVPAVKYNLNFLKVQEPAREAVKVAPARRIEAKMLVPAMPANQQAADEALVARYIQIYKTQFRPVLQSELYFMRAVCSPTKEQRAVIIRDGEAALDDAVKQYAEAIVRGRRVVQAQRAQPDPRYLVQVGLTEAMRKHLTADQLARYQEEATRRNEDREQAAIHSLVARVDQDLILTAEQREKLCAAMQQNWNQNWLGTAEVLIQNPQLFPQIPDNIVTPILTPMQRTIWNGAPKYAGGNTFTFGRRTGAPVPPDLMDEVDEPPVAPKANPVEPRIDRAGNVKSALR